MLQPEDVVKFCLLKKHFRADKSMLIIHQAMTHQVIDIKGDHMLRLLKRPWEVAFCREEVLATWKVAGYVPLTHQI